MTEADKKPVIIIGATLFLLIIIVLQYYSIQNQLASLQYNMDRQIQKQNDQIEYIESLIINYTKQIKQLQTIIQKHERLIEELIYSEEYLNFSEFTPVGDHIVIDSYLVRVENITKGEDSYLYLEKESIGSEDFGHEIKIRPISYERGGLVNVWALTNKLDDWFNLDEGIAVHLSRHETDNEWRIRLKEKTSGGSTFYSYPITDLSWKYLRIEQNGQRLSVKIYNNERTQLLSTLELDVTPQPYRYLVTACSSNAGKSDQWITAEMANLIMLKIIR